MDSMDRYLCEFFYNVMHNHLMDFLNIQKVRSIKRALPEIRRKHKGKKAKEDQVHSFPVQKYVFQGKEIAYFFESSTCLASSMAKTFQELVESNQETFKKITQKKTINICCVPGGIASELVAVIKILRSQSKNYAHYSLKFINASNTWDNITSAVLNELQSCANEEHIIKLSWDFVPMRNRNEHHNQEILEIFQSADILLARKFSQELSEMKDKQLEQLLQVGFPQMKSNSLCFFIDTSTAGFIKHLEKTLSSHPSFKNIYKKVSQHHTLSINAIEDHLKRYREHFGVDLNSSYCLLSVSAWLKEDRRRNCKQEGSTLAQSFNSHQQKTAKQEARKSICKQESSTLTQNFKLYQQKKAKQEARKSVCKQEGSTLAQNFKPYQQKKEKQEARKSVKKLPGKKKKNG